MPPRALAASLVAVLVPLGAGCGVGGGGSEDDVRAVVKSYIGASLDGNGRQACAFYTRELGPRVRKESRHACPRVVGRDTRTRLAQLPFDVRDDVEETFDNPDEIDVDVTGDDQGHRAPGDAARRDARHAAAPDPHARGLADRPAWARPRRRPAGSSAGA